MFVNNLPDHSDGLPECSFITNASYKNPILLEIHERSIDTTLGVIERNTVTVRWFFYKSLLAGLRLKGIEPSTGVYECL